MTLDELAARLRKFAADRDWEQFHTPRNLALALGGEMGELFALFQWDTDAGIAERASTAAGRQAIADELADVLIYLVRLADVLGIDLAGSAVAKIEDNGRRYPAGLVQGTASKRPH